MFFELPWLQLGLKDFLSDCLFDLRIGIYKNIIFQIYYKVSSESLYISFSYYLKNIIQVT